VSTTVKSIKTMKENITTHNIDDYAIVSMATHISIIRHAIITEYNNG
jgi:hypothetical protein